MYFSLKHHEYKTVKTFIFLLLTRFEKFTLVASLILYTGLLYIHEIGTLYIRIIYTRIRIHYFSTPTTTTTTITTGAFGETRIEKLRMPRAIYILRPSSVEAVVGRSGKHNEPPHAHTCYLSVSHTLAPIHAFFYARQYLFDGHRWGLGWGRVCITPRGRYSAGQIC